MKMVHKQELRGCSDLFIWFGCPFREEFPWPSCLLISCFPNSWLPLAVTTINQFPILFSLLWALRKCCSAKMSPSTFSRTVFLYVFGDNTSTFCLITGRNHKCVIKKCDKTSTLRLIEGSLEKRFLDKSYM